MKVEIVGDDYVLSLKRLDFLLLVDSLNEHLLLRGEDFDVVGRSYADATRFLDQLGRLTEAARLRAERGPADAVEAGETDV